MLHESTGIAMTRPTYTRIETLTLMNGVFFFLRHLSGEMLRREKYPTTEDRCVTAEFIAADVRPIGPGNEFHSAGSAKAFANTFDFPCRLDLKPAVFAQVADDGLHGFLQIGLRSAAHVNIIRVTQKMLHQLDALPSAVFTQLLVNEVVKVFQI